MLALAGLCNQMKQIRTHEQTGMKVQWWSEPEASEVERMWARGKYEHRVWNSFQHFNHLRVKLTLGFPGGSDSKTSACNAGDLGLIPRFGRSPGEWKGYPLQYYGLENPMDYSPWGCKESDMTEQLSLPLSNVVYSMGRIHHFSKLRIKLYYLRAKTGSNITL